MKTPQKHAELIKAWADGAEIEWYDDTPREHRWKSCGRIFWWDDRFQYRIKPEPKPDVVRYTVYEYNPNNETTFGGIPTKGIESFTNIKLTFDGETGKLKSAEVL